ncbi:hypothetical protein BDP81DRAFT_103112 [Colletotrichum phormii]|uniref:Uncharacterized protein n=1 Tax=Colletotrichum phormii TaxID=359342 RepID=A0AAI9ZI62_9PEZI|nr:uncharacterized protein BDP81DRAFT_103112 [Colletotrichum phormii]KAK1624926.1 hypothetical protein BDP81DRAFT_103112 [Colletotrichum phormii]
MRDRLGEAKKEKKKKKLEERGLTARDKARGSVRCCHFSSLRGTIPICHRHTESDRTWRSCIQFEQHAKQMVNVPFVSRRSWSETRDGATPIPLLNLKKKLQEIPNRLGPKHRLERGNVVRPPPPVSVGWMARKKDVSGQLDNSDSGVFSLLSWSLPCHRVPRSNAWPRLLGPPMRPNIPYSFLSFLFLINMLFLFLPVIFTGRPVVINVSVSHCQPPAFSFI